MEMIHTFTVIDEHSTPQIVINNIKCFGCIKEAPEDRQLIVDTSDNNIFDSASA